MEQFLAAFVSIVVLSSYLGNVEQFKMIRCFQSILSWPESSSALIGHAIHEDYRGVGMVMTYFSTLCVAAVDVYLMLQGLCIYSWRQVYHPVYLIHQLL